MIELAQNVPGSGAASDFVTLLNYGVAGILLILLISGRLRHEREVQHRDEIIERLSAQNTALTDVYQKDVIPTLIRTNDLLTRQTKKKLDEE